MFVCVPVDHRAEPRKLVFVEIAGNGFLRVHGDVGEGVGDMPPEFAPRPCRLEHGAQVVEGAVGGALRRTTPRTTSPEPVNSAPVKSISTFRGHGSIVRIVHWRGDGKLTDDTADFAPRVHLLEFGTETIRQTTKSTKEQVT